MIKVEIRDDSVKIDGYVNAVERDSKVLTDIDGDFIERIKAGAFQRALDRARRTGYAVKVLLNHDYERELTNTGDVTTNIVEDNIGLRCTCEIRDEDVVKKAKERRLSGWSFGFIPLMFDEEQTEGKPRRIDVRELDLKEVSILDDTRIPAYNGTSIETRAENHDDLIRVRMTNDSVEFVENFKADEPEEKTDNSEYERRYLATKIGALY